MERRAIIAEREIGPDGKIRILSPTVGWWEHPPRSGAIVGPASAVGQIRRLNHRFDLLVPDGVVGQVTQVPRRRRVPAAYGQTLFELSPLEAGSGITAATVARVRSHAGEEVLPSGHVALSSPTDGIFYRRPAPDSPPFVAVGATVQEGQPVGLVEVMKTFNQIHYGGPGLPRQAEVVEIRCEDGEEVQAEQILMVLR